MPLSSKPFRKRISAPDWCKRAQILLPKPPSISAGCCATKSSAGAKSSRHPRPSLNRLNSAGVPRQTELDGGGLLGLIRRGRRALDGPKLDLHGLPTICEPDLIVLDSAVELHRAVGQ